MGMWPVMIVMILGISGWWIPFFPFTTPVWGENSQLDSILWLTKHWNQPDLLPKNQRIQDGRWRRHQGHQSWSGKSTAATARRGMAMDGHPWCWTFFNVFFVQTFDDDPTDSDSSWFLCEAIHSHGMPWVFDGFCMFFVAPKGDIFGAFSSRRIRGPYEQSGWSRKPSRGGSWKTGCDWWRLAVLGPPQLWLF